jgi:endonuclease IV
MSIIIKFGLLEFIFLFKGEYMKYSVKELANKYIDFLAKTEIEVSLDISHRFDKDAYNDYNYKKMIAQFEQLYNHIDSVSLTEEFLKGD